jgi:hypothetical protein
MSKIRMSILATLAVVSFGLGGISAISAAPANGNTIDAIKPAQAIEKVYCYRCRYHYGYRHYGYRHCWWRYGHRYCHW